MAKLVEARRALVHCSGYDEERRSMMKVGIERVKGFGFLSSRKVGQS
jgi:hypothetical protein